METERIYEITVYTPLTKTLLYHTFTLGKNGQKTLNKIVKKYPFLLVEQLQKRCLEIKKRENFFDKGD